MGHRKKVLFLIVNGPWVMERKEEGLLRIFDVFIKKNPIERMRSLSKVCSPSGVLF